jgi:hypothetical protein
MEGFEGVDGETIERSSMGGLRAEWRRAGAPLGVGRGALRGWRLRLRGGRRHAGSHLGLVDYAGAAWGKRLWKEAVSGTHSGVVEVCHAR